jgi:hypothetical protein
MLQESKNIPPAPNSIHGTDANNGAQVRQSVSHHGNEGRGRGDVPSQNHRSNNPQNPSILTGPTGSYSEAVKPLSSYAMNVGLAAPRATHYNHYEPYNGGYITYESKNGMPNSMTGGAGAGGGGCRLCARVLTEVLAGTLSIFAAKLLRRSPTASRHSSNAFLHIGPLYFQAYSRRVREPQRTQH